MTMDEARKSVDEHCKELNIVMKYYPVKSIVQPDKFAVFDKDNSTISKKINTLNETVQKTVDMNVRYANLMNYYGSYPCLECQSYHDERVFRLLHNIEII